MPEPTEVLTAVTEALSAGELVSAARLIETAYPFHPASRVRTTIPPHRSLSIFVRDGFLDRYRGSRPVFPGALHLISCLLPEAFPYHPHGHMHHCHLAFWQLFPTVDHIVPIARGGSDHADNLACTSMLNNQIKAGWLLSELGWSLRSSAPDPAWDGLVGWFRDTIPTVPRSRLERPALWLWASALRRITGAT